MIIKQDKPRNTVGENKGVFQNSSTTYNATTYNASTYVGEDRTTDVAPIIYITKKTTPYIAFKRDYSPIMVAPNLGVYQSTAVTYNASTYNAATYAGEDRITDVGPFLYSIKFDSTPAPAPPPGGNSGQPYGLLLSLLQP